MIVPALMTLLSAGAILFVARRSMARVPANAAGRTKAGRTGSGRASSVQALPVTKPQSTGVSHCDKCNDTQSATATQGRPERQAQFLVYCLECGGYWLAGSDVSATIARKVAA